MRRLKFTYHIIRSILVSAIAVALGIYIILLLILSSPGAQNKIREIGEEELSKLLHTEVTIGKISIAPFNQVMLYDVDVADQKGDKLLKVSKIGAGISLYNLIMRQRLVFTYAEIIGLEGAITKSTPESPTNMQFIIDALSSKEKNKPPTAFDLKIYNVVIRKGSVSYDILSEPRNEEKFDKNHIKISNLTADIALPRLKNDDFIINIKRLALREECGFDLKNLAAEIEITKNKIQVNGLRIELPNSIINPEPIILEFNNLNKIGEELPSIPINFNLANGSIVLHDLRGFVPKFSNYNDPMQITFAARGTLNKLSIPVLNVTTANERIAIDISGTIYDFLRKGELRAEIPHIEIKAKAAEIANITSRFTNLSPQASSIISNCGNISFEGSMKGSSTNLNLNGNLTTSLGAIYLNGDFSRSGENNINMQFNGNVNTSSFKLGELLNKTNLLGETSFKVKLNALKSKDNISGMVNGLIDFLDFKGYRYSVISTDMSFDKSKYEGVLSIDDPNLKLAITGLANLKGVDSQFDLTLNTERANLAQLNLDHKHPNHTLSLFMDASFTGNNLDNADGSLFINGIKFIDNENKGIKIDHVSIEAHNSAKPQNITIDSDIINGTIIGFYDFKCLIPAAKEILSHAFPTLFISQHNHNNNWIANNFKFNFTIEPNNQLTDFFNTPVRLIHPITLTGEMNETAGIMNLSLNAPYLQQKNKVIENSSLNINIDNSQDYCGLKLNTLIPNQKGNISLALAANGANDRIDTDLSWWVARNRDFHGKVNLSALINRNDDNKLSADISINPTELVFNDTTWNLNPAKINISPDPIISIDGFDVRCDKQFVKINGKISNNPDDQLLVALSDINLDYIFQTLEINNVAFGGRATGEFNASSLLTKTPILATPNLHVEGFSYNNAPFGIADIESHWDPHTKGININAIISQANGFKSEVHGSIFPTMDSLYLDFEARKLDVRFLKPFLAAITTDIQGYGSGNATLFGNFKRIDLRGDILAEDLRLKIDYINTYYTTTDSVKLRPGYIQLKNITLKDKYGKTAILNGSVSHSYFHDASFNFSITKANDFLCFDIPSSISPTWYGTIYGNGSAFITGEPGEVNIDVNMATAANSKFTFVLSNTQAAGDYTFITIVDRDKRNINITELDTLPELVRQLKMPKIETKGLPSTVNLNIQVEATPLAQLNLIMDPVGGDRIKSTGSGNLRLTYNSTDDDIKMFGNYTLEKGNYNFTLQDIIIKDFNIKEGSSISFHGDPLFASLNIGATYNLNANLTDLDESFAQDKDLNRTNVPVHAVLNVNGDIKQPAISFDIEFPTLTQEAYRKVKSIISTEDMMNRQIIYLLALNRFYTPEYMGNTNKNNEFASVASSTLSSQLSNILGQLSENWSISPNFRTEKGDFSDMEVDIALSSQLLNNRLLFNGNFGYRDKSLNANSSNFIGDFDIEYLLTKNGNIRLKAYNHYNDQNYYIKSALTTQGVGVVFKYDFDRPFDFLRKKRTSFLLPLPLPILEIDSTKKETPLPPKK